MVAPDEMNLRNGQRLLVGSAFHRKEETIVVLLDLCAVLDQGRRASPETLNLSNAPYAEPRPSQFRSTLYPKP